MNLIVLAGPGSCGKTTTRDLAYDDLLSKGAVSTARKKEGGNPNDFSDVLHWKGKQIGYLTMGDYSYRVLEFLRDCQAKGYDDMVAACNDRFVKPFNEFAKYPSPRIMRKIKAARHALHNPENTRDAAAIVSLL